MSFEAEVIPPVYRRGRHCMPFRTHFRMLYAEPSKTDPKPLCCACCMYGHCAGISHPLHFWQSAGDAIRYPVHLQLGQYRYVWHLLGGQHLFAAVSTQNDDRQKQNKPIVFPCKVKWEHLIRVLPLLFYRVAFTPRAAFRPRPRPASHTRSGTHGRSPCRALRPQAF